MIISDCGNTSTQSAEAPSATTEISGIRTGTLAIHEDEVFQYIVIEIEQEEMADLGFELGDSLKVSFSNGKTIDDIPYHNGYYVEYGALVTVAYPGFPNLNIAYNLSQSSWEAFGLKNGDTVIIELNEKGKYMKEQELFSQKHSDDPKDFETIEKFCNFRSLEGGTLKKDLFYRSASATNNSTNRASYVDGLIERYGIHYVLDLSDTAESLAEERSQDDWASVNFDRLYEEGNVNVIGLGVNPASKKFQVHLCNAIYEMIQHEGPYLFFCAEGKDRTGYVAALLEALCGATYDELLSDYMKTYEYFYNITKENKPDSARAAIDASFDPIMKVMFCTEENDSIYDLDYASRAREFCRQGDLSDEQIDEIIAHISEESK